MYSIINQQAKEIINHLVSKRVDFIQNYPFLIEQLHTRNVREDFEYQSKYRHFCAMNRAIASDDFYETYFSIL